MKPPRHEGHEELTRELEQLGHLVIGAAIQVHRVLGPGFMESAYEKALSIELTHRQIMHACQVAVPVHYRGVEVGHGVADIVVGEQLILELKATAEVHPIHEAQLMSYLRATGMRLGYVMNFHRPVLKDGLRRIVL